MATTMMNRALDTQDKTYTVTLVAPDGQRKQIKVHPDEYISDAALTQGINLPSSCNAGVCVSCTARLSEGKITHDHTFLTPKEEKLGFLLTCKTLVKSDCVILTEQEDQLLDC